MHGQAFVWCISVSLGYTSRSGIAGSHDDSMLTCLRSCQTRFTKWLHPLTVPPTVYECFHSPTASSILVVIQLFDDSHPRGCEFVSHLVLICISLMTNDVEHFGWCTFLFLFLFLFLFFLAAPRSLWDLSSLTRDWTRALSSESVES